MNACSHCSKYIPGLSRLRTVCFTYFLCSFQCLLTQGRWRRLKLRNVVRMGSVPHAGKDARKFDFWGLRFRGTYSSQRAVPSLWRWRRWLCTSWSPKWEDLQDQHAQQGWRRCTGQEWQSPSLPSGLVAALWSTALRKVQKPSQGSADNVTIQSEMAPKEMVTHVLEVCHPDPETSASGKSIPLNPSALQLRTYRTTPPHP